MNGENDTPAPAYQTRRATLEDLPQLRELWAAEHLSPAELEKRFLEFQLAIDHAGQIAGVMALQMSKSHGLVHSEAFRSPEQGAELRPLLWQRILMVAKNNGLLRLWALPTTSFYREQGMTDIDDALRARMPEGFGSPNADWVSLKLREENPTTSAAEQEFEIFAMSQRAETERLQDQAKAFRVIAYALLLIALGALGLLVFAFGRLKRKRQ